VCSNPAKRGIGAQTSSKQKNVISQRTQRLGGENSVLKSEGVGDFFYSLFIAL
jgi:hypothetical protein